MKVETDLISIEWIKPSSPTPDHLRQLQYSFLDQIQVKASMPIILFYSKEPDTNNSEICSIAKKSLSQVLTIFYPLAGRVKGTFIDCSDEGVLFVEALANCRLVDYLSIPYEQHNNELMPLQPDAATDLAAFFQITFFKCGGFAISFSLSHKLGDGVSQLHFLNSWAAITRGDTNIGVPHFGTATLFPPGNLCGFNPEMFTAKDKIVTKWFAFDASKIAALRAKYTENDGSSPSRVEALASFIFSRFMAAAGQAKKADGKLYALCQVVNLRPRMEPPLPELYFGNFLTIATAIVDMGAKYGIISPMREALRNVDKEYVKKLQKGHEHLKFLRDESKKLSGEIQRFSFSSLCKFPLYEVDYGWGKPVWVDTSNLLLKNIVYFSDTKEGGGMEARISLKEEDMAKFEVDKELLAHVSSFTPSQNLFPLQTLNLDARSRL